MKWPRTLFGQIALALFVGLLVAQLAGLALMVDDRGRLNYKLLSEYAAQRMGGIAAILDEAEAAERPALIRALSVPPTMVSLNQAWAEGKSDDSADAQRFMANAASQFKHPLTMQMLSIERLDPVAFELVPHDTGDRRRRSERGLPLFARTYMAQVKLSDGIVVTFHHQLPVPGLDLSSRLIGLLALLGISVGLLSLWAVRRLTRPLEKLASAATGLARNLDQPPLSETGPVEMRQAAAAFNAMQRDLKRLIDTRAQALSAVSHDLRLPITRMRLRLESGIAPEVREKMGRDLSEMDTMIGQTLDFLRAGSNTEALVPTNLDALIDSVSEDMEELGATISRHGHVAKPIAARPHALRRCIANLLDNARRYGGGQIDLSLEDSFDKVCITITDHGAGIAEADLEKVCEPYFRLEASRAKHTGGTGLGLAIAKAIIEAHGGTLSLASKPGVGLTVKIDLPRSE